MLAEYAPYIILGVVLAFAWLYKTGRIALPLPPARPSRAASPPVTSAPAMRPMTAAEMFKEAHVRARIEADDALADRMSEEVRKAVTAVYQAPFVPPGATPAP